MYFVFFLSWGITAVGSTSAFLACCSHSSVTCVLVYTAASFVSSCYKLKILSQNIYICCTQIRSSLSDFISEMRERASFSICFYTSLTECLNETWSHWEWNLGRIYWYTIASLFFCSENILT